MIRNRQWTSFARQKNGEFVMQINHKLTALLLGASFAAIGIGRCPGGRMC